MRRFLELASLAAAAILLLGGTATARFADAETGGGQPAMRGDSYPATMTVMTSRSATSSEDPLDQVICRIGDAPTGSRLGATHECHTRREWNNIQMDERQQVRRSQSIPMVASFLNLNDVRADDQRRDGH